MTRLPPGVKATSGGTFNRDEPPVYFLASNPEMIRRSEARHILVAVNEISTKKAVDTFEALLDEGRQVMLDSGIFNLASEHARNNNVTHDEALSMPPEEIDGFDKLWDQYGNITTKYADRLWGIVELDQGGIANKPRTRARIEKELGITPIPVYHPLLDGWDYYDTLATGYDRICFGNIVQASPPDRLRLAYTAYERGKQYPYLWTHLLGMTPNQNILAMPFRGSMDSSSWLAPARWPHSWRATAMLAADTAIPPSMWLHSSTDKENYDRSKLENICVAQAAALQATLEATREDTHPLTPSPNIN